MLIKQSKNNVFIAGAVVLFLLFICYPIINSIILSTQSCSGSVCEFVGFGNVKKLFTDDTFKTALFNTFTFLIIQVPIMIMVAILLAALLNQKKLKFRTFYRTAIFLPCVTSLVAYSILFKLIFSYDGIVNNFLVSIGVLSEPYMWLSNALSAKVIIIIALLWRWTGYNMIFYLAGMQNIPGEIYEASLIDGASKFRTFFQITLPNLKPIILFTAIMSTIGTLQLFDEPVNLTAGGPGIATTTISQYIYETSFIRIPDFGYAVTMSYVIVIIVLIISLIQNKLIGGEGNATN